MKDEIKSHGILHRSTQTINNYRTTVRIQTLVINHHINDLLHTGVEHESYSSSLSFFHHPPQYQALYYQLIIQHLYAL